MAAKQLDKLVIAISSRALFDLDDAHQVYEQQGLAAYSQYQIDNEHVPLEPGTAFSVVRKLLGLNDGLSAAMQVEVVLLSRNSADTGLRVFNSIEHYGLPITRAAFCGGESPWRYINAFGCQLFLSAEPGDVRKALENQVAAATLVSRQRSGNEDQQLRFAFDGDAVLFSDEAEQIFKRDGLEAFTASEHAARHEPLQGGAVQTVSGVTAATAAGVSCGSGAYQDGTCDRTLGARPRARYSDASSLGYPDRRVDFSGRTG